MSWRAGDQVRSVDGAPAIVLLDQDDSGPLMLAVLVLPGGRTAEVRILEGRAVLELEPATEAASELIGARVAMAAPGSARLVELAERIISRNAADTLERDGEAIAQDAVELADAVLDEGGPPNLDDYGSPDELRAWATAAMRDPEATAERWGRGRGMAPLVPPLVGYARKKARAMELRAAGEINRASVLEQELDNQYRRLPHWARW